MVESKGVLLYRLWFSVIGVLVIGNMILLTSKGATHPPAPVANISYNPNAVDRAMSMAANESGHAVASVGYTLSSSTRSVATTITRSFSHVDDALRDSVSFAGRNANGSLALLTHTVGHLFNLLPNTLDVNAMIKPSDKYRMPVIIPVPALIPRPVVQTASQITSPPPSPQPDSAAQWPIHGAITTQFGVPELPYERIHTGLDISDGKPSGSTPIKPYKSGVVSQTIRSYIGLGNHIIIDNGGGITSVYGHLNSIAVTVGQHVDQSTILGYEGTTGASTGTHLHFEIRVNGQAVNPLLYITGRP